MTGEWIAIEQWEQCRDMARPGIVFEIRNGAGNSMFTPCIIPLPAAPFDWTSGPTAFRAVSEKDINPGHSAPLPAPKG